MILRNCYPSFLIPNKYVPCLASVKMTFRFLRATNRESKPFPTAWNPKGLRGALVTFFVEKVYPSLISASQWCFRNTLQKLDQWQFQISVFPGKCLEKTGGFVDCHVRWMPVSKLQRITGGIWKSLDIWWKITCKHTAIPTSKLLKDSRISK